MKTFRVEWAFDIEAETPREAVEKACAEHFPRVGTWSGVFDVYEIDPATNQDHGAPTQVDLDELEEVRA